MAYASRAMRGLIIDYARERRAQKRGGGFDITALPTVVPDIAADVSELQPLSDALDELATVDPDLAELVDLKFFCGFSFAEIAAMRSTSERTVRRDWSKARLYCTSCCRGRRSRGLRGVHKPSPATAARLRRRGPGRECGGSSGASGAPSVESSAKPTLVATSRTVRLVDSSRRTATPMRLRCRYVCGVRPWTSLNRRRK